MSSELNTPRSSRARFLTRVAVAGGGALAAGRLAGIGPFTSSAASPKQDREILNLALTVEYLQAELYSRAVERGALRGELRQFARTAAEHERAHVQTLRKALGPDAVKQPRFDFGDAVEDPDRFRRTAVQVEDALLAAYNGNAPNLSRKALAAAAPIVSVEARHAAWVRDLAGELPAPRGVDAGLSAQEARSFVERTGFIR